MDLKNTNPAEGGVQNASEPLHKHDDRKDPEENHRRFSDTDTGWAWAILFASFASFILIGGTLYGVGIIHSALLDLFGESISVTAWAGALHSALPSAGGPLSSLVMDRFSCRVAMITSGVFFTIGYFMTAFAPNIEVAIVACGIFAGLGGAFGYTACMVVVNFNFVRYRNIALGLAISGVGAGVFLMAPVMQMVREYFGPRGFFILLAGLSSHLVAFGIMCFPSRTEMHAHTTRKQQAKNVNKTNSSRCSTSLAIYRQVIGNMSVLCLCFGMFNYCLGTLLIYLHLPSFIISKGFSASDASYVVSITGVTNIIGRILTGLLANWDRLDDIVLYAGSMGIVSIVTFLYPLFNDSYAGQVAYAAIFGLFLGACYVVLSGVNIKLIGMHNMAAAIGLEFFFGGVGSLVGPVLAGFILDTGGTYEQSFIIAALCILVATVLSVLTVCTGDKCRCEAPKEKASSIEQISADKQVLVIKHTNDNIDLIIHPPNESSCV